MGRVEKDNRMYYPVIHPTSIVPLNFYIYFCQPDSAPQPLNSLKEWFKITPNIKSIFHLHQMYLIFASPVCKMASYIPSHIVQDIPTFCRWWALKMAPCCHFRVSLTGLHGWPVYQTFNYGRYPQIWLEGWVLVTPNPGRIQGCPLVGSQ